KAGPSIGTAELALISKRSAASRRDAPASAASITRSRRSPDSAFGIVVAPTGESMPIDSFNQTAPPDSNPTECALVAARVESPGVGWSRAREIRRRGEPPGRGEA